MSQIQVNHLTFYYEGSGEDIFQDVSFSVDTDWKLGLIGRNGKGKTTFLKLLMGEYEYRGTILASVEFEYFPFPVKNPERMTIDIVEELYPDYEEWKLFRELKLLEADAEILYRPFETLSNGERTKVLLAVLFLKENKFLLIDEPTNHLDREARAVVSRYLNRKSGFILVSHDRAFLDGCIDHVLSLNRNSIEVVQGNFSSWWENKQQKDASEQQRQKRLKKEIGRLQESAGRNEQWSSQVEKTKRGTRNSGLRPDRGYLGHKAAKLMKRAKAAENRMEQAIEEKKTLLKDVETADMLKIVPLEHHKDVLIRLEQAVFGYPTEDESELRPVCGPVNMELRRGQKLSLTGRNGCGKSTILRAILEAGGNGALLEAGGQGRILESGGHGGILEVGDQGAEMRVRDKLRQGPVLISGHLTVASGLRISHVSQDTSGLTGGLDAFAEQQEIDSTLFRSILRKLDFTREQFEKEMQYYSEGQKKKVLLAKSLCEQAHLYLWDEPLNFIDIFSRIQLEELLCNTTITMLLVEHDKRFTKKVGAEPGLRV